MYTCDRLNNGSTNVYILIPEISEYATLHGKGGFVDVIKSRILRLKDYPVCSVGPI